MIIVDCESSGLDYDSYPIQIAWVDTDSDEHDSFYIKPAENWIFWDEVAESIHNIPRKLLFDIGLPYEEAAQRLYNSLRNETILYCDAPSYDGRWIMKLFETAKLWEGDFDFFHIASVFDNIEEEKQLYSILRAQDRPHDALGDCQMIKDAYWQIINERN